MSDKERNDRKADIKVMNEQLQMQMSVKMSSKLRGGQTEKQWTPDARYLVCAAPLPYPANLRIRGNGRGVDMG